MAEIQEESAEKEDAKVVSLEQIFSDIESSHAASSVSSCESSLAGSMKNIKLPVRPFDRGSMPPEDSRREFYAKCLSVKFSFPPSPRPC